MPASTARMDAATCAMCYALRNPPAGGKTASFKAIAALVVKTDGTHPSGAAVHNAVKQCSVEKQKRGRKSGWKKTTAREDREIMKKFKYLRPPGHGIDSRILHRALPAPLRRKVSRRTVIRRLADKGFIPMEKSSKSDPDVSLAKKRVDFAIQFRGKSGAWWARHVQAIGDMKEFTYYPPDLKPRFKRYRARWTYMNEKEKHQPAFCRPKR